MVRLFIIFSWLILAYPALLKTYPPFFGLLSKLVNGSVMNRQPVAVGNVPPATVKVVRFVMLPFEFYALCCKGCFFCSVVLI